jgi:hypothetical protein
MSAIARHKDRSQEKDREGTELEGNERERNEPDGNERNSDERKGREPRSMPIARPVIVTSPIIHPRSSPVTYADYTPAHPLSTPVFVPPAVSQNDAWERWHERPVKPFILRTPGSLALPNERVQLPL